MEYDKSKVYTALNADELKVGSKVIVAYTLKSLKSLVKRDDTQPMILDNICSEEYQSRFVCDESNYTLAYLVEEPEDGKLKWTDLKVGDVITNGKIIAMVTVIVSSALTSSHIYAGTKWLCSDELKEWKKVEC